MGGEGFGAGGMGWVGGNGMLGWVEWGMER